MVLARVYDTDATFGLVKEVYGNTAIKEVYGKTDVKEEKKKKTLFVIFGFGVGKFPGIVR
jgi:hypothetical protein